MNKIKQIDNRASGTPKMKYQYFELCQLAEYPEIKIKINTSMGNDYAEAEVWFDDTDIDDFNIKEVIEGIVQENLVTIEKAQKREMNRRIKLIKQDKCPCCFGQLTQDKGTYYCKRCDMHYDSNGTEIKTIKITVG